MATYRRKVKFFPTRRNALLSSNLQLTEAVSIFLESITAIASREAFRSQFTHIVQFFGETTRLRSIHKLQFSAYASQRLLKERAAQSTIESELAALRRLMDACYFADLTTPETKPGFHVSDEL
jgi:hypothetical protein